MAHMPLTVNKRPCFIRAKSNARLGSLTSRLTLIGEVVPVPFSFFFGMVGYYPLPLVYDGPFLLTVTIPNARSV
jgi:hypothetical protein